MHCRWLPLLLLFSLAPRAHALGDPRPSEPRRSLATFGRAAASMPAPVETKLVKLLVPSFARQTGMHCAMCHYQFPQLTPFGRQFKLNGYTLSAIKQIEAKGDSGKVHLSLASIPPVSMMVVGSATQLADALPGTQNGTVALPQQLSLFLAGAITPKIGSFAQLTYSSSSNTIEIDNVDFRYASQTTLGETNLAWGVTLNNNPTVQDLWNTTPAWGVPFLSSATTAEAAGNPMIAGGFGQRVVGLGVYGMWNEHFYTELTAYRSSVPGGVSPLDSSARGTISGFAPYWRFAYQATKGNHYLMVGTFGMSASLFPEGVSGPTDTFTDIGFDAQHEMPLGTGHLVSRLSWITEDQKLTASAGGASPAAANVSNSLSTVRLNSSWYPSTRLGLTLGVFSTTGTTDALLYAPAAVSGSANGKPETTGAMFEVSLNSWENSRLMLQYTLYSSFNGGSSNYDSFGRKASSNNSLYAAWWFAF